MNQETYEDTQVTGWVGWITFAAVMLAISGGLNFFYGLIAAINDEWVVFGNRADVYLDVSAWGWIHMILGIVMILTALGLFAGQGWARWVGIFFVMINAFGQVAWMSTYPIWSILIITLDIIIIYQLTARWDTADSY